MKNGTTNRCSPRIGTLDGGAIVAMKESASFANRIGRITTNLLGKTSKRPLVANPSGLAADDMVVYLRMASRAERR